MEMSEKARNIQAVSSRCFVPALGIIPGSPAYQDIVLMVSGIVDSLGFEETDKFGEFVFREALYRDPGDFNIYNIPGLLARFIIDKNR